MQWYTLAAITDHLNIHDLALWATRTKLDFIYTAQYHAHTNSTLAQLKHYNEIFYKVKDIFIHTGARCGKAGTIKHFNIPKLHTHHHYVEYIKWIGGTANVSTETPEWSHQDFAKDPFKVTSTHDVGFPQDLKARLRLSQL